MMEEEAFASLGESWGSGDNDHRGAFCKSALNGIDNFACADRIGYEEAAGTRDACIGIGSEAGMVFICVVNDIDAWVIPAFTIQVEDIVAWDTEDVSDAFTYEAITKKLSNGHVISPNALRRKNAIVCTAYAR